LAAHVLHKSPPFMSLEQQLQETVAAIRTRAGALKPRVGIVLGSGLGAFADGLSDKISIPYGEIRHFPASSVAGHAGRLVFGTLLGQPLVAMQGRVHAYEGYSPAQVVLPTRVLCLLGIEALVVTNAAGGINASLSPGDLMAITDHINLAGWNPLTGPNLDSLGPRFPDMSRAYHPGLLQLLLECAQQTDVLLRTGVYAIASGPSYETPAEIRMLRTLGADAVGMSTVPEVIAAAHMGVPVAGISCVTNLAAGIGNKPLSRRRQTKLAYRSMTDRRQFRRQKPRTAPERRTGERRESPRVPMKFLVRDLKEGGAYEEREGDLSVGGIWWAGKFPPLGRQVELRFRLPGVPTEIRAQGEIIKLSEPGRNLGFHARFTELDVAGELAIAKYIDELTRAAS
jgi:purine-nucleoside phosphorylase